MPKQMKTTVSRIALSAVMVSGLVGGAAVANATQVPGYVPPVTLTQTPTYADDTRGVYVPSHQQHRLKTASELSGMQVAQAAGAQYNQPYASADAYMNQLAGGYDSYEGQVERIAQGQTSGYQMAAAPVVAPSVPVQYAQPTYNAPAAPMQQQYAMVDQMPNTTAPMPAQPGNMVGSDSGVEVAVGEVANTTIDMRNSLVRLREDRVTVRRALQRMMDQIGGGDWAVVWDLAEQNAGLPEMEISIHAEEPFVDVMNALLARIQTRSGQPLRVIRYDRSRRLVITDRSGGHRLEKDAKGLGGGKKVAVTENVLKESNVTLHFDEIPLVDALENIVNQAGKGEWRLRMYAGLDQVLKPAHVEEPFTIAMERLLKLFNLKYEIFPGGKLIVVTNNNRFGFSSTNNQ